jgi:hypothetical protein
MKTKETAMILALLLSIILLALVAKAQDENSEKDTLEKDMHEVEIMHFPLGSQVRLMQLENGVQWAADFGKHVIDVINDSDYNVSSDAFSRMGDIVSELKDIKTSLDDEISKNDTNSSVEFFVSTKGIIINLTQEFRTIAREQLMQEQRKNIVQSFREDLRSDIKKLKEELKSKIMEFNRGRALNMFLSLKINETAFLERYQCGNITFAEFRQTVKDRMANLTPDGKKDFLSNVKDERKGMQLAKVRAFTKKINLTRWDADKMKNIVSDSNFTYGEASAKLGVFVRQKIQERKQIIPIINNIKDASQERRYAAYNKNVGAKGDGAQ